MEENISLFLIHLYLKVFRVQLIFTGMKTKSFFTILILFLTQTVFAQTVFTVTAFKPITSDFKYLLLSNSAIADNDTINEKIVDLVNPMLLDSVIERKKQHLKILGAGWLIHFFGGYNWRAMSMNKQKFVGTVTRNTKNQKEKFTEYDINFDLNFHLHKYMLRQFLAYDLQKELGRQDYRGKDYYKDYSAPPFVRDTNNIDIKLYRLHCELTPAGAFRSALNDKFYPTLPDGGSLKQHLNFGTDTPTMGFYGTICLDCNHSCHPELHPYEWAWWLNTGADTVTDKNKTWLIGLFHESSNRMKKWSQNPMVGSIEIPFVMENASDNGRVLHIGVEHLVYGKFRNDEMKNNSVPDGNISVKQKTANVLFAINSSVTLPAEISFNESLNTDALKYWFSDLSFDPRSNVLSGYLHFSTAVDDLYTTRITFYNN